MAISEVTKHSEVRYFSLLKVNLHPRPYAYLPTSAHFCLVEEELNENKHEDTKKMHLCDALWSSWACVIWPFSV